ncbi:MAG: hypothetical protein JWR33_927 [Naasia sp.]|uniref:hypothetical protein n=1 Tax=Naasia sp. TaxID=2546198 RepID=UPI002632464D|nr:hypothetical protein [Naasia sp.]MCU1570186.1 hypothetical protein [Naasia sp.]
MPDRLIAGAAACLVLATLWGQTISNPFVCIARVHAVLPSPLRGGDRLIVFFERGLVVADPL